MTAKPTSSHMQSKMELRRAFLKPLKSRQAANIRRESTAIAQTIIRQEWWGALFQVGVYAATQGEISTDLLQNNVMDNHGLCAAPAWNGKTYVWRLVDVPPKANTWRAGKFGLLEPAGKTIVAPHHLRAILVPGLAFDRHGNRLGRGGGHYDRLLAQTPNALLIAPAFEDQIVDQLPTEKHDVPVDIIVTGNKFHFMETAQAKLEALLGGFYA